MLVLASALGLVTPRVLRIPKLPCSYTRSRGVTVWDGALRKIFPTHASGDEESQKVVFGLVFVEGAT